ncbi:hypothetical protein EI18_07865 [Enterococcus hirae]|nr:hypothetical protein EI18_07865 [Enterococcus hirae]
MLYFIILIGIMIGLINNGKKLMENIFFRYTFLLFIYSLLLLAFVPFQQEKDYLVLEISIPLGIMITSSSYILNTKEKQKFLNFYVLIVTILSLSVVFYYNGGFSISQLYTVPSKNQIGPLIGGAFVIGYISFLERKTNNHFYRIINLILLIILGSTLIAIRNRTGILGIILFICIKTLKKFKINNYSLRKVLVFFSILFFILTSGYFLWGKFIIEYINTSLFTNYDLSDLNSLSAGRISGYTNALNFIRENFLFGNINAMHTYNLSIKPHNFILYKLVQLGAIFAMPFIFYYCFLIRKIFIKKSSNEFSSWLLLFSIFVSLFEYAYPFGPGVSQFMLWFLIAQESISNTDIKL